MTGAPCSWKTCTAPAAPGSPRCPKHDAVCARLTRRRRELHERELAERLRTASRCPRGMGGGVCGGPIRTDVGRLGQTIVTCEWCERRKRGICRDCDRPVYGMRYRAVRCAQHAELARREQIRASGERHHDAVLARARRSYQENADVRRRRNEYKRAWRKANREKVRAQKRRYIERHAADPTSQYSRYHAKYRAKYRLQKLELERGRLQAAPPPRKSSPKCTKCGKSTRWTPIPHGHGGKPWTICTACLFPCQRAERLRNRRRARQRAKEWLESLPSPGRIRRPPQMAERGPGWERLCITPGCDIVVTHRRKKCTKCRARDAQLAIEKLASHRGRGRRTDMERVA